MITFKIEKYFYNIIEKNKPKMRKIDNKYFAILLLTCQHFLRATRKEYHSENQIFALL